MNCYRCATPIPEHSRFCLSCGADVSGESGEHTLVIDVDPRLQTRLQEELGDDFVIERELGHGGMAAVFLGRDTHLKRKVAIKVLPPELTVGGAGWITRFKREAETAATLDHPHIIPIYRVSTGGKLFWYVMKFLEGESLDRVLQREGRLTIQRTVDIVGQVALGLDHADRKGVVHRDVKPANVMIDTQGWVTVTDFGIAKAVESGSLTGSGSMIGTPYYMSPEQCSGRQVTGASDQYALGVMTYQMLSGQVPFTGESTVEIIKKHCFDPVPPLGALRPELPAVLVGVVERALAKMSEDRFPTCGAYAKALGESARGVYVGEAWRSADTVIVTAPRRAPTRRRVAAWGAVGVSTAVLALAIALWPRAGAEPGGALPGSRAAPDSVFVASPLVATPQPGELGRANSTVTSAAPPRQARRDTARPPTGRDTTRPAPPIAAPPLSRGVGYISVGSRPSATIWINGREMQANPVVKYEVRAGLVTVRFQVADTVAGVWSVDTSFTVAAGDTLNIGRIPLRRP